jgi:hypothetical protein
MMISPEALGAAASRIEREWGYGYWIERVTEGPTRGGATLHVVAGDGSRFTVAADRWGNPVADGTYDGETRVRA